MRRCEAAFRHVEPAFQKGRGKVEREMGKGKWRGKWERESGEGNGKGKVEREVGEGEWRGKWERESGEEVCGRVCACAVRVVTPHTTTTTTTGLNSAIRCFTSKMR